MYYTLENKGKPWSRIVKLTKSATPDICASAAPPLHRCRACKSQFYRKCGCSFASNQASILILLAWLMSGIPFCLSCYHMATSRVYKFSIKCFILLAGAIVLCLYYRSRLSLNIFHVPSTMCFICTLLLGNHTVASRRAYKQSLLHQYASLNLGHILLRVVEKSVVTGHWMRDLVLLCCVHSPIVVSGYITWGGS